MWITIQMLIYSSLRSSQIYLIVQNHRQQHKCMLVRVLITICSLQTTIHLINNKHILFFFFKKILNNSPSNSHSLCKLMHKPWPPKWSPFFHLHFTTHTIPHSCSSKNSNQERPQTIIRDADLSVFRLGQRESGGGPPVVYGQELVLAMCRVAKGLVHASIRREDVPKCIQTLSTCVFDTQN